MAGGSESRIDADAAHARSVGLDVAAVASALQGAFGQALLGVIVGKDARTIARWASGTVRPPYASEQVLRDTFQVLELLMSVESPEVARAWFMGMNPQLDDVSPAEALSDERSKDVMAAARAYVSGR
ncbi:XRE family transcriptional regulator [Cryobacterium sp. Y50]|uniref:XRE family transcriptional regulator n=1 Tax=Cryobacterium sp. Y50 TaxID=2048286 RepID=UPI000CE3D212|nr:XRE family transcriptional regulator [Cryobacterium sp. Y50]